MPLHTFLFYFTSHCVNLDLFILCVLTSERITKIPKILPTSYVHAPKLLVYLSHCLLIVFRSYVGLQLRLRAALKVAVNTLVRVPLVMREPNVLGKLVYSICLEAADGTCNLALRVNVGLVSLKNITTLY